MVSTRCSGGAASSSPGCVRMAAAVLVAGFVLLLAWTRAREELRLLSLVGRHPPGRVFASQSKSNLLLRPLSAFDRLALPGRRPFSTTSLHMRGSLLGAPQAHTHQELCRIVGASVVAVAVALLGLFLVVPSRKNNGRLAWVLAAATGEGEEEFDHTKNYYAVLGVPKDSSKEELKRAHRKLMLKYHPDVQPEAGAVFQLVNDAYRVLTDEELRRKYDRYRTNWCKWNGGFYDDVTGAVIEKALLTPKVRAREKALLSECDFYTVLGVPPNANVETIREAYTLLLRQCHPDVSQTEDAKAQFQAVTEAYAILSSPLQRRKYDDATEWRRAQGRRETGDCKRPSPDH
eukprot:GGOE01001061.1.p1 GENE.GGOE01001061.1~~GGOE01001061.1.p1  ORF type:complete len:346 (+),score=79.60 GGOE01001061.1:84-1121(+)